MVKYREIAICVLKETDRPLTPKEIWEIAETKGIVPQNEIEGKTPIATMASLLFRESNKGYFKGKETPFKFTKSPRRYWLEENND